MSGACWWGGTELSPVPAVFRCCLPALPRPCPVSLAVVCRVPQPGWPGHRRGPRSPLPPAAPAPAGQDGGGQPEGSSGAGAGRPAGAGLGGGCRAVPWVCPGFAAGICESCKCPARGGVLEHLMGLLPRGLPSPQNARQCWFF